MEHLNSLAIENPLVNEQIQKMQLDVIASCQKILMAPNEYSASVVNEANCVMEYLVRYKEHSK